MVSIHGASKGFGNQSLNSELVKVNPSNSCWLTTDIKSGLIGVKFGFSDMKSTSKLLKSRFDLCSHKRGSGGGREGREGGEGVGRRRYKREVIGPERGGR